MINNDYWVRQRLSEARLSDVSNQRQLSSMSNHKESMSAEKFSSAVNQVDSRRLVEGRPVIAATLNEQNNLHPVSEPESGEPDELTYSKRESVFNELTGLEKFSYHYENAESFVFGQGPSLLETVDRYTVRNGKSLSTINNYQQYFSALDQFMGQVDEKMAFIDKNEVDKFLKNNQHTFLFDGGEGGSFAIFLQKNSDQSWFLSIDNIDLPHANLMQLTHDLKCRGLA